MALPTITSNSPSAGYIAWTAFAIQYGGVSYSVAAGNTANKYTYWLYNNGVPTLNGGNTLPDLGPDDLLLFLNKAGVGALVPTLDVVDGSLIVTGSILANAIGADQINGTHIAANAITADEIAANAVTASEIAAGAITTEKLSVGTVSDSLVTNGSFEEYDAAGMPLGWKSVVQTSGTLAIVTGIASSGTNALRLQTTVAASNNVRIEQTSDKYIPVSATAGRKWYVSMRYGAGTATTNGAYLRVQWYDANKVYVSYNDILSNAALPTVFTIAEGQVTPPSTARYMGIQILLVNSNVATSMYVDEVIAREVIVSAIIGDGQITTVKMTANTINADRLQAGTVTATQLAANTITADKLTISDFSNYLPGGNFDNATDMANWALGTGVTLDTTNFYAGTGCLAATGQATVRNAALKNKVSVVPGDTYYTSFYFKSTADFAGSGGNGKLRFGDQNGGFLQQIMYPAANTTYQKLSLVFTIPAGVTALTPTVSFDHTAGTVYIDSLQLRRMSGGELIVDGTITALELATDSVTSDKILANAIISAKIAANAIQANHIAAGQIQAGHIIAGAIDGMVITGGELRTTQSAGQIAARMGPSAVWDPSGGTTQPGIGFTVAGNTDNPAGMFSPTGTDLKLTQGGAGTAGNQAYMTLGSNNAALYGWGTATITGRGGVTIDGQVGTANVTGTYVNINSTNGTTITGGLSVTGDVSLPRRHFESNIISTYPPNNTTWGPGIYQRDPAKCFNDSFITFPTNDQIKFLENGVYCIQVTVWNMSTVNTSSRILIQNGDRTVTHIAQAKAEGGVWEFSCTLANYYATANEAMMITFAQNSGGGMQFDSRLRVTKLQ